MKIYKKYLISNLFRQLLVSLVILVAIIWSTRIIKFMDLVVYDGAGFTNFFKLTLYILPSLILVILPLSMFLTIIITYNRLIENREIVILKNCGVKKIQLLNPLLILSVIITIFSLFLGTYLSNKSNMAIREIKSEIKNNLSVNMIKVGSFTNIKNLVIYADKRDDKRIYNVIIYNQKNVNKDIKKTSSNTYNLKTEKAQINNFINDNKQDKKDEDLKEKNKVDGKKNKVKNNFLLQAEYATVKNNIVELYNGNIQKFLNNTEDEPDVLFFKKYNVDINSFLESSPNIVLNVESLPTLEIINILRHYKLNVKSSTVRSTLVAELNYRIGFPFVSIIIALLCGSIILQGSFNRLSNSRTLIETSAAGGFGYIILLWLFQRVENQISFIYILYIIILILVLFSSYLIKEKRIV